MEFLREGCCVGSYRIRSWVLDWSSSDASFQLEIRFFWTNAKNAQRFFLTKAKFAVCSFGMAQQESGLEFEEVGAVLVDLVASYATHRSPGKRKAAKRWEVILLGIIEPAKGLKKKGANDG